MKFEKMDWETHSAALVIKSAESDDRPESIVATNSMSPSSTSSFSSLPSSSPSPGAATFSSTSSEAQLHFPAARSSTSRNTDENADVEVNYFKSCHRRGVEELQTTKTSQRSFLNGLLLVIIINFIQTNFFTTTNHVQQLTNRKVTSNNRNRNNNINHRAPILQQQRRRRPLASSLSKLLLRLRLRSARMMKLLLLLICSFQTTLKSIIKSLNLLLLLSDHQLSRRSRNLFKLHNNKLFLISSSAFLLMLINCCCLPANSQVLTTTTTTPRSPGGFAYIFSTLPSAPDSTPPGREQRFTTTNNIPTAPGLTTNPVIAAAYNNILRLSETEPRRIDEPTNNLFLGNRGDGGGGDDVKQQLDQQKLFLDNNNNKRHEQQTSFSSSSSSPSFLAIVLDSNEGSEKITSQSSESSKQIESTSLEQSKLKIRNNILHISSSPSLAINNNNNNINTSTTGSSIVLNSSSTTLEKQLNTIISNTTTEADRIINLSINNFSLINDSSTGTNNNNNSQFSESTTSNDENKSNRPSQTSQVGDDKQQNEYQQIIPENHDERLVHTSAITTTETSTTSPELNFLLSPSNSSADYYYNNSTSPLRILSQIRRDLSQRIGKRKVPRVVDDFILDDELEVQECDRVFISTPTTRNGTFESPKLIAEEDHSVQCIFTFVPRPGERVQVSFTRFNVRGIPPECTHEWIDLYTEVDGTDVTDLISTPFAGRYCGLIAPRPRISLFGGIAIGFYSDRNVTADDEIRFSGKYSFISDDRYIVGTPVPRTICSFTILGSSKRQGDLRSPTYPGIYPKDLACTYKFIGTPGQRIRIEFRDFDVFSGGLNCPFDDVKVYDGMDPTAPIIGTFCGPQRYLVLFSSEHLMFVTFTTRERTFESQNRGFTALWEFSESFVKLDFIGKNAGEHIRGTECDQQILSNGTTQGAVYSPNYPFPYLPKIYCKYYIYGLQDHQNLERVKLSFEKFDVPSSAHSEEDLSSTSHHKDKESKCGDGNVKIYVKGQEVFGGFDKPDYEFCGKEIPEEIASDQPRLVLAFSSGEIQGSGFKAKYAFEIEYRIPGTPAPDHSCHFTYLSTSSKFGDFNSPRFPSNYPSNMTCTYLFVAQQNEQVRIVFDHFKIYSEKANYTGGAYGKEICVEDWVEIYNVFRDKKQRLIGRYCSRSAPGPIESHEEAEAVKIVLHLDADGVYSGFKARYVFFTSKSVIGECGMNYSATVSGTLTSPGWPGMYEGPKTKEGSFRCNWFLAVKPGSRILLHFEIFSIEGHPFDRGCPAAAVRVWEDPHEGLPIELCGEGLTPELSQFVSVKNFMRVTFITADKAVGDRGFAAVWSEVQDHPANSDCQPNFIPCAKSPYCIPSELHCDGIKQCGMIEGEDDASDESLCGLDTEVNVILIMVLSIGSGSCCLLTLCVWGQRKRSKRRRRQQSRRPPIHVCDNAGARFAAMDSV